MRVIRMLSSIFETSSVSLSLLSATWLPVKLGGPTLLSTKLAPIP